MIENKPVRYEGFERYYGRAVISSQCLMSNISDETRLKLSPVLVGPLRIYISQVSSGLPVIR